MSTKLKDLLDKKSFGDAASLLKETLSKAEIIDPSNDKSWAPYADFISSQILSVKGQNAFNIFWEDLLKFFKEVLEPSWGHLHKGHIFFRLGLAKLVDNLANAKEYLEEALAEDKLLESKRGENKEINIEKRIRKYSAYVMLCIIERIEEEHFSSNTEKQKFFELITPSFDAAIFRGEVNPTLVQNAIVKIIPSQALEQTLEVKKELDLASAQQLQTATVSLAGTFLESVLLGILYYQRNVKTINEKDIREVELGKLLSVAIKEKVFPSDAIRASCQTIRIFRNRLHPGNELQQQYKLTPRVANTLKILLDLTLVEWAKKVNA